MGMFFGRIRVLAVLVLLPLAAVRAQTMTDGPLAAPASVAPKSLTNDSVIRMVNAGLQEDLILQTIATQPGQLRRMPTR